MNWDAALDREIWVRFGPFDESDEVNHDPDSLVGEEDESGFDEMAGWPDWQAWNDEGHLDSGGEDDDEAEDEENEEGGDC